MSRSTPVQCFGITHELRRCTRKSGSLGDADQGIFCHQHASQETCDGLTGPTGRDRAVEGVPPSRRCRFGPACKTCGLLWGTCPLEVILQAPHLKGPGAADFYKALPESVRRRLPRTKPVDDQILGRTQSTTALGYQERIMTPFRYSVTVETDGDLSEFGWHLFWTQARQLAEGRLFALKHEVRTYRISQRGPCVDTTVFKEDGSLARDVDIFIPYMP
jgi:hypothetical protein